MFIALARPNYPLRLERMYRSERKSTLRSHGALRYVRFEAIDIVLLWSTLFRIRNEPLFGQSPF